MKKLTANFSLDEMTATSTGLANVPGLNETEKLFYLCSFILEKIRTQFGPVRINSGFRSLAVNQAIGGAAGSQHMSGEAADISPVRADINDVFNWVKNNLVFGQIIDEDKKGRRWIHISLPRISGPNQQALRFINGVYLPG
jgi:zinc D-Ala-D-Ala carboxypeptidase